MFNRRSLLKRSSLIAFTPTVPTFLARTAQAAGDVGETNRKLVIIQLDGGNDGINTVVPYGDEGYAKYRKQLRLPENRVLKINDHVGLHPAMRGASELLNDGMLAIVQGVGYPNPNRSHFRSMAIWQTARFDESEHNEYGWVGRALDGNKRQPDGNSIYVGDDRIPIALRGRRSMATSLLSIDDLKLGLPIGAPATTQPNAANDIASFVSRTVTNAYAKSVEFEAASKSTRNVAIYPATRLGYRMKLISQLLKADQPARIYYTSQPGYDTHAAQLATHFRLLSEFSSALKAFIDDLTGAGITDIVVMAFSEFGRRVNENGSVGTDHGTSGPVFLAGNGVNPGLHGQTPSMIDLQDGDLAMHVDFRSVYHALLTDWLGLPSSNSVGTGFNTSTRVIAS